LGGGLDFWPFWFGFLAFSIGKMRWIPEALSGKGDGSPYLHRILPIEKAKNSNQNGQKSNPPPKILTNFLSARVNVEWAYNPNTTPI